MPTGHFKSTHTNKIRIAQSAELLIDSAGLKILVCSLSVCRQKTSRLTKQTALSVEAIAAPVTCTPRDPYVDAIMMSSPKSRVN